VNDAPPLIETVGLTVRYGARVGIQQVSLAVRPGELVALVGPNGAGKTTFVRAVLGLVPPTEGEVRVGGTPVASLSFRERARRMAWLPQEEQPQENVPILDYVLFGRYAHVPPFYSEDSSDYARAEEALRSVNLWDRRTSGIWEVSGGERQRVLLARALTQDAPTLLLDEPTSHLDIAHQLELLDRLQQWRRTGPRCVVAAMHDLNLATRYADRVVVLSRGRLVEDGRPQVVLSTALLRSVWGIDAEIRRDTRTGLPYIVPTLPAHLEAPPASAGRLVGPVHVVGGGGAATPSLRALVEEGFLLTAGVLALLDTDTETAQELGVPAAVEAPFSAIGEEARQQNHRLLAAARAIVVAPFAVGPANLVNLVDLVPFAAEHRPIYLLEGGSLSQRDFTGGQAQKVRDQLLVLGARDVGNVSELVQRLRADLRASPAFGSAPGRSATPAGAAP
jgi:iron complex transport system ATP-binding protein